MPNLFPKKRDWGSLRRFSCLIASTDLSFTYVLITISFRVSCLIASTDLSFTYENFNQMPHDFSVKIKTKTKIIKF